MILISSSILQPVARYVDVAIPLDDFTDASITESPLITHVELNSTSVGVKYKLPSSSKSVTSITVLPPAFKGITFPEVSVLSPLSTSRVKSAIPTAKLVELLSPTDVTVTVPAPPVLPGCNFSKAIPKLSVRAVPDEGRTEPKFVEILTSEFLLPSPLCSSITSTNNSPSSDEDIVLATVQPDAVCVGSSFTLERLSSQPALQPVKSFTDIENCAKSTGAESPDE